MRSFYRKGGRFGPAQGPQDFHLPDVEKPGNLIYLTYFNAGLRIYNITDPIQTSVLGRCASPIVLTWNHFLPDDCMAAVNAPPIVGDSCRLHDTTYQFFREGYAARPHMQLDISDALISDQYGLAGNVVVDKFHTEIVLVQSFSRGSQVEQAVPSGRLGSSGR